MRKDRTRGLARGRAREGTQAAEKQGRTGSEGSLKYWRGSEKAER